MQYRVFRYSVDKKSRFPYLVRYVFLRRAINRPALDALPHIHHSLLPLNPPSGFLTFRSRYVEFDGRWQQQLGACSHPARGPEHRWQLQRWPRPLQQQRLLPEVHRGFFQPQQAQRAQRFHTPQAEATVHSGKRRELGPRGERPRPCHGACFSSFASPMNLCCLYVSVDCRVFSERRGVTLPPPCAMDQPHGFSVLACA